MGPSKWWVGILEVCVVARARNEFWEFHRIIEMVQSGPGIARIEMHIIIVPRRPDQPAHDDGPAADLDRELEEFKKRHGQG
jgi:hypothetical protein